ncbi:MAG: hypothetical protein LQ342_006813 [Letrouitia transgressa]|nr:MAG: hypothetical protein LQ342_006813 [Letrouitia transgressa]
MQFKTLLPFISLLSLSSAAPAPANNAAAADKLSVSVDIFDDTKCALPTERGLLFNKNNVCQQFIKQEGSFTATSAKPVKSGCVLQVFADTSCTDVLAAITIDGTCQAPLLGPASSGKLAGC